MLAFSAPRSRTAWTELLAGLRLVSCSLHADYLTWTPKVCKIMAFLASFGGSGPLFYILSGSRDSWLIPLRTPPYYAQQFPPS